MAKDTVTLSIEEYNRLRDFERDIKEEKVLLYSSGFCGDKLWIYTKEDAINFLLEENKGLGNEIDELMKEKTPSQLKKMNIWEFLKWRKS